MEYLEPDDDVDFDPNMIKLEPSASGAQSHSQRKSVKEKKRYPYRCSKCPRRFVYKEVFEGHMRMHKGLPAFT